MNKIWKTSLIVFVLFFLIQISLVSALEWNSDLNPNLITYFNFNAENGIVLEDVKSNNENATLINMEDGDWTTGKIGNSLVFDGVNEHVKMEDNIRLNFTGQTSNQSISFFKQGG